MFSTDKPNETKECAQVDKELSCLLGLPDIKPFSTTEGELEVLEQNLSTIEAKEYSNLMGRSPLHWLWNATPLVKARAFVKLIKNKQLSETKA